MKTKRVVTCFLRHDEKILLMKRSDKVGSYKGKWGVAAGYIEDADRNVLERAITEVREETGLKEDEIELVKRGGPFLFTDERIETTWHIHPFLFEAKRNNIKIDWEHTEFKWIEIKDFDNYDAVLNLKESLRRVLNLH